MYQEEVVIWKDVSFSPFFSNDERRRYSDCTYGVTKGDEPLDYWGDCVKWMDGSHYRKVSWWLKDKLSTQGVVSEYSCAHLVPAKKTLSRNHVSAHDSTTRLRMPFYLTWFIGVTILIMVLDLFSEGFITYPPLNNDRVGKGLAIMRLLMMVAKTLAVTWIHGVGDRLTESQVSRLKIFVPNLGDETLNYFDAVGNVFNHTVNDRGEPTTYYDTILKAMYAPGYLTRTLFETDGKEHSDARKNTVVMIQECFFGDAILEHKNFVDIGYYVVVGFAVLSLVVSVLEYLVEISDIVLDAYRRSKNNTADERGTCKKKEIHRAEDYVHEQEEDEEGADESSWYDENQFPKPYGNKSVKRRGNVEFPF